MPGHFSWCHPRIRPTVTGALLTSVWIGVGAVGFLWLAQTPPRLSTSADYGIALARLSGLLTGYAAVVLVALMARLPWIERHVGSDRLTRWHAIGGRYTVVAMVVHIASVVWSYARSSQVSTGRQVSVLLRTYPGVLLASIAAAVLIGVALTSVRAVRRAVGYQAWYRLHLLTYVGVALAFSHQLSNGTDFVYHPAVRAAWVALYGTVAAALGYGRLVRPLVGAARQRLVVAGIVDEAGQAISVEVRGRGLGRLRAESGQFFRLRFLSRGRWYESHPFSLSAAPTPHRLRFTVKPVGSHTRSLRELVPGTRVLAAGPFGTLTAQRRRNPKVLLIAGGIGITPLRALFESLPVQPGQLTLIYRCRAEADLTFRGELDELARNRGATVIYLVGRRADRGCRLDSRSLAALVPDLTEHDVYVCAPPALITAVTSALRQAGVPARQIHRESFEPGTSSAGRVTHAAAVSLGVASLAAVFASRSYHFQAGDATDVAAAATAPGTSRADPRPARTPSDEVVLVGSLQRTLYTSVQVAAVLRDGRLVDVRALALPSLDARSRQISAMAAPILRREAIASGSAHVDTVSGATYTSEAYAQSLQAALDSRPPR